ncbi:MAG: Fe-S-containing protein [Actinobacteria bacterium]|nr:Fe-S-containing protein [Actinomycetota bacterium]
MGSLSNILEATVIAIREGIEATLVVGIVLAYLQQAGRPELRRFVWLGVCIAVMASVAAAFSFQIIGVDADNDLTEGITMLTAGLMVGTLVVWMFRQGKSPKREIEDKLDRLTSGKSVTLGSAIGMLLFVFFMVGREGIETVLFLLALGGTVVSNPAYNLIGGILGIGLAIVFGVLLFKGCLRINLSTFFRVTSIVLLILVVKLLIGAVHGFSEAGLFTLNGTLMSIIGWVVKDSTSAFILMLLIGLPALMVLKEAVKVKPVLTRDDSKAEHRKRIAKANSARRWGIGAGGVGLAIVVALATATVVVAASRYDPDPQPKSEVQNNLEIPIADLADNMIHKYSYTLPDGNGDVRILVVYAGDNYMAAYDACQVCPSMGFMQQGNQLICKNCNAPVDMSTLPYGGGCNPIPLPLALTGQTLTISLDDMLSEPDAMSKFMNS